MTDTLSGAWLMGYDTAVKVVETKRRKLAEKVAESDQSDTPAALAILVALDSTIADLKKVRPE